MDNPLRAEVLVEALPYIQEYAGKVVVIKYGGNAMINEELKTAVMGDITLLTQIGVKVVLVHGGGPEISDMLKKVGKSSEFKNGLRVTDAETVEIVRMVLCGKINKSLVSLIQRYGCRAVGLGGMDGNLISCKALDPELGFVGDIDAVDPQIVFDMLDKGYIPVISTVGQGANGEPYNINADTAAARVAAAMGAECMISMTDIPGLLRDKDDPDTLISRVNVSDAPRLMREGVISGGMIPKVDCCIEAIRRGVKKVFILDGRVKHSILIELLTDEGLGTMFL